MNDLVMDSANNIESGKNNIESEKWKSYAMPNIFDATRDIIGWTITSSTSGIIGVIVAVDKDNILFFAKDGFDKKYSMAGIKDKIEEIVIDSMSFAKE